MSTHGYGACDCDCWWCNRGDHCRSCCVSRPNPCNHYGSTASVTYPVAFRVVGVVGFILSFLVWLHNPIYGNAMYLANIMLLLAWCALSIKYEDVAGTPINRGLAGEV